VSKQQPFPGAKSAPSADCFSENNESQLLVFFESNLLESQEVWPSLLQQKKTRKKRRFARL